MEAKAVARYVHQSPRKIRKTLDSMRGLKVGDALNKSNQKKFGKLPIKKMANVAWKLVS